MSLTLLYRGKNVRFSMQLAKLHWLSAVMVFALLSGIVVHLMFPSKFLPQQAPLANEEIHQKQLLDTNLAFAQEMTPLSEELGKSETTQRLTALTIKLAELQSQVLRLNALGDRLAEDAEIPEKEFNFNQVSPSGGPALDVGKSEPLNLIELLDQVTQLEADMKHEEKQLQLLESLSFGHHIENNGYLSGRPISKGWLSSYYGMRKDPFSGRPAMHKGVDFAGKEGTNVIATAAGVVTWAGKRYGYGQLIEIDHGDSFKTRYGHNKTILVKVGDVVSKGQSIAKMGSTGRSTGPHVHYEILRNNSQINPIKYVYRKAK